MKEINMDDLIFTSGKDGKFSFDRNLTIVEILGIAIKAEVNAYGLYKRIAKRITNPVVQKRVLALADDEQNHRIILSDKYTEMTGESLPPLPPTGDLRAADLDLDGKSNKEVLEIAAAKEAQATRFYLSALETVKDPGGRAMLEYLGEMERTHEEILRQEIKALEKNPLWHDQQVGQLFHIGP
jgi:rubrerythrin